MGRVCINCAGSISPTSHAICDKCFAAAEKRGDEMVRRNRLLRDRPDLPADRTRAADEYEAKIAELEAENADLRLQLHALNHGGLAR